MVPPPLPPAALGAVIVTVAGTVSDAKYAIPVTPVFQCTYGNAYTIIFIVYVVSLCNKNGLIGCEMSDN